MYKKLLLKAQYVQHDEIYNDSITVFDFGILKIFDYNHNIKKINFIDVNICNDIVFLTNKKQIAILKNCAIL